MLSVVIIQSIKIDSNISRSNKLLELNEKKLWVYFELQLIAELFLKIFATPILTRVHKFIRRNNGLHWENKENKQNRDHVHFKIYKLTCVIIDHATTN